MGLAAVMYEGLSGDPDTVGAVTTAVQVLERDIDEEKTTVERSLRGLQSPKWSHVVKRDRRVTTEDTSGLRTGKVKKPRVTKPIVGTGAVGNIRTIRTKL